MATLILCYVCGYTITCCCRGHLCRKKTCLIVLYHDVACLLDCTLQFIISYTCELSERIIMKIMLRLFPSRWSTVYARASCARGGEFESQRPAKSIYSGSMCCLGTMTRDGHRKLVTRFGVIRRI